jgi:hypothetical protein
MKYADKDRGQSVRMVSSTAAQWCHLNRYEYVVNLVINILTDRLAFSANCSLHNKVVLVTVSSHSQ